MRFFKRRPKIPPFTGREIDFTRRYWGHNVSLNWNTDKKIYSGFVWSTPGPKPGDRLRFPDGILHVLTSEWTVNVDDMFKITAFVLKEE